MGLKMGLLGKKIGMTQTFNAKGEWVALTVLSRQVPCVVVDIKTDDRDGYARCSSALMTRANEAFASLRAGSSPRPSTSPKRLLREFRLSPEELGQFEVGQSSPWVRSSAPGDFIDATGASKGKGFQGVMKRYHFSGFKLQPRYP